MTIHQSKGLEFPIVVLPDLQQKISITDTKALGCARLGERVDGEDLWEVGLQVPIEDGQRAYESMVLRTLIRERNRAEQLAESRRLLYVAMTRARDQLLCVSRPPSKAAASPRGLEGSKSWEEWIRSWLDAGGDALVTTSTDVDPSAKDHIGEAPGTSDEQTAPRAEDIQPLTANCSRVITPHALTKTDQKAESHSVGPPGEGAQLGKLRGLLVHSCLEDGLYETSEETERRLCSSLAREGLLSEDLLSLLREELDRHLRGFKAAAPEQLLHTNQDSVFRELPFRLSLPNDAGWLKGVIDLVYRDEARQCWVVLDYKSDSSVPSELSERYRGQLTAYAWAASQVLPDLTQNGWRVETQLLCTAHGARHVVTPAATADEVARQFSTVLSTEL